MLGGVGLIDYDMMTDKLDSCLLKIFYEKCFTIVYHAIKSDSSWLGVNTLLSAVSYMTFDLWSHQFRFTGLITH